MEDWIKAFKEANETVKKETAKKSNPYFKEEILKTLNTSLEKEKYKFAFSDDKKTKLIPEDIKKALNSEMGTPMAPGKSGTKEIPSEVVRTFISKISANIRFKQHFDLKLKLDRPNEVFEIEIIAKDKEK